MLTVLVPATQRNLTTPARVQSALSLGTMGAGTIERLIAQASAAIANHCRRPFGLETVREHFDEPRTSDAVLLSRDPVVAFVEIKDSEEIIAPLGYRYDATTGLLRRVDEGGRWFPWQFGRLAVTYQAGYVLPSDEAGAPASTLPEPVERAATRLIAAYLSVQGRDPLIKSETVEGVGSTTWYVPGPASVLADPEAEQLLLPYRRLF